MNITIDIECDSINELRSHLSVLRVEVGKKSRDLNLDPDNELPEGTKLEDNNCYGTHTLTVLNYEE